jgi:predicted CXXCH cytochrome family protein
MNKSALTNRQKIWLAFALTFAVCTTLVAAISLVSPAAAQTPAPTPQSPSAGGATYAGSQACELCHEDIHKDWQGTRHSQAFSSPIFQRDWTQLSQQTSCLQCHTTGFDPATGSYVEEGVTCESCHGPFRTDHPAQPMPIKPDADLCARCHQNTTDEWKASPHNKAGVQCQACHNPHAQVPMADSITALCTNCHKERGDSFTHSTHANAGLECSNCHMYRAPRTEDPIGGLVPTGHTFTVGSDACIGCHKENVHTRDELVKLGGQAVPTPEVSVDDLKKNILEKEDAITTLQASAQARLYTGLIQGAIIGLVTGGAVAWVISRRIKVVEVEDDK